VNLIEFIGFIITILAMFVILIRRSMEERRRRQNPELYEQEEEDREKALKEFLRTMNLEVDEIPGEEERPPPPPPPPKKPPEPKPTRPRRLVRDAYELESSLDDYERTSGIESHIRETEVGKTEFGQIGHDVTTGDLFMQPSLGAYDIIAGVEGTRASHILSRLDDPTDMIVYHEIIGKPRALQRHTLPHDLAE